MLEVSQGVILGAGIAIAGGLLSVSYIGINYWKYQSQREIQEREAWMRERQELSPDKQLTLNLIFSKVSALNDRCPVSSFSARCTVLLLTSSIASAALYYMANEEHKSWGMAIFYGFILGLGVIITSIHGCAQDLKKREAELKEYFEQLREYGQSEVPPKR